MSTTVGSGYVTPMTSSLASTITKAASRQTYYTIRTLVDRSLVDDAFRAYAYFRWVDDVVDAGVTRGWVRDDPERLGRVRFLDRQRALLETCLSGGCPHDVDPHEAMLVDLVRHDDRRDGGLEAYLRNMLLVMDFDVGRRGRLISAQELDDYTRWLSIAVTEAMHHFIGSGAAAPRDETRYLAVSGAHVVHMLRDTYTDVAAGYYNVPREVLAASSIGPLDVRCDAYRAWVIERARLARRDLAAGRSYFERVQSLRHRLAGLAYIARFECILEMLERDDYRVRAVYHGRPSAAATVRIGTALTASLLQLPGRAAGSASLRRAARHQP